MNGRHSSLVTAATIWLLTTAVAGCGQPVPAPGTLAVAASSYPVAFLAQRLGGDRAEVFTVTPPGTEPHDYEPSARDLVRMDGARLVVLTGGGFESWADKIRTNLDPQRTTIVEAGEGLMTPSPIDDGESMLDPHVWLDPQLAHRMADRIALAFRQVDPEHAADYAANAGALTSALNDLDAAFREGLARCAVRDIVTSHAAFGYLAAAYDLRQVPIAGLTPDAEPSPRQLAAIVRFAREHRATTIFFERLLSPGLSQTIAAEVGAKTMLLDPIEGLTKDDLAAGRDYLTAMRQNLTNLETALQCTP